MSEEPQDERSRRIAKVDALRAGGTDPYPVRFDRTHTAAEAHERWGSIEAGAETSDEVRIAGRLLLLRRQGKLTFATLRDGSGDIQLFVSRDAVGEDAHAAFDDLDRGDWVGATGTVMKTRKGELSVRVDGFTLLSKALRPLPEKWHGLSDVDTRFRQRYVDLIANDDARRVFEIRFAVIATIRRMLTERGFVEVETPVLHAQAGGAAAKPFETFHNALDMPLVLRIALELHLKRLLVGGLERVFEIGRVFRNEGLGTRYNPEFTMLELYQAYADYHDLMDLVERMLRGAAEAVVGSLQFSSQGRQYNLSGPFARISVEDLILRENPDLDRSRLRDLAYLRAACEARGIPWKPGDGPGKLQIEIFEKTGEQTLLDPTFVYAYPAEVSPLSRANDADPFLTDRFEFFVGGRELANGFSELNDAEEQAARFQAQVARKESGDDEAMFYDADYVRALEYGLPPTAGLGVGIDRLVMFLTDSPSIRDVLLFPQMRPE